MSSGAAERSGDHARQRRMALGYALFSTLVPVACTGPNPPSNIVGGPAPVKTAGTLVYPNNDLHQIPIPGQSVAFVASTVGLSTVELVHEEDGGFEALPLVSPPIENADCSVRTPVATAVGDVNADGLEDVLVSDPCGNWVSVASSTGDFSSRPWTNVLPTIFAYPFLEALEASATTLIIAGTESDLVQLAGTHGSWSGPSSLSLPFPYLSSQVTDLIGGPVSYDAGSEVLLVQSYQRLLEFPFDVTEGGIITSQPTILGQALQAGYLVPFEAFDHLAALTLPTCDPVMVGVGLFSMAAGPFPRTLQRVLVHPASFETEQIQTALDSITTLSVVTRESEGYALLLLLGSKGQQNMLDLWRYDCAGFTELTQLPIEFDWRTPPAPLFGGSGSVVKTEGVKLVAVDLGAEIDFIHYDGYDVRVFGVSQQGTGWVAVERKYSVHQTRGDLAFGSPPP
jgi:hypothetical protein